jgi:hypothetical protein
LQWQCCGLWRQQQLRRRQLAAAVGQQMLPHQQQWQQIEVCEGQLSRYRSMHSLLFARAAALTGNGAGVL